MAFWWEGRGVEHTLEPSAVGHGEVWGNLEGGEGME